MNLETCIREWNGKKRRMGCVAAANFVCQRVPGFRPERLTRYTKKGDVFEHVVATNGSIRIDLAPYADRPKT